LQRKSDFVARNFSIPEAKVDVELPLEEKEDMLSAFPMDDDVASVASGKSDSAATDTVAQDDTATETALTSNTSDVVLEGKTTTKMGAETTDIVVPGNKSVGKEAANVTGMSSNHGNQTGNLSVQDLTASSTDDRPRNLRLAFIGDSVSRYQYLDMAYYLLYGEWFEQENKTGSPSILFKKTYPSLPRFLVETTVFSSLPRCAIASIPRASSP